MEIGNDKVAAERATNGKIVSLVEIDRILDCIGSNSKHALLYYLQTNYNIFSGQHVVQYEDLERALHDLVGEGAVILLGQIMTDAT